MDEALFSRDEIVEVSADTLRALRQRAAQAPRGRYRLCMHRSVEDQIQEMVIVCPRGTYFRPHRHPEGKTE